MMNLNDTGFSADYTNRDYYSIRTALITRIQNNINTGSLQWTGQDPSDFGVALVEAFAYATDLVNYYIDKVANETVISTASQRKSIVNIAKTYGYFPANYRAASLQLTFSNSSSSARTLGAGTQCSGYVSSNGVTSQVVFSTNTDIIVPAISGSTPGTATVYASNGILTTAVSGNDATYGEKIGTSSGYTNQFMTLSSDTVVDNSLSVYVKTGSSYALWNQVNKLSDYGASDYVYSVEIDEYGNFSVNFGDGVNGAIPSNGSSVYAKYLIGGGQIGNVTTGIITTINSIPGYVGVYSGLSVTNSTTGVGGADPESNTSIKFNAPQALTAINRAVTLNDFASLALGVYGVGKANAVGSNRSSVTLYIAPEQSSTTSDIYPGYDSTNTTLQASWTTLQTAVKAAITPDKGNPKVQVGTTVTYSPPTYVPINMSIVYQKSSTVIAPNVEQDITTALLGFFSYTNMVFGDIINPEDVESVIKGVPGVNNAKVTYLYRASDSAARNILKGAPNELFVLPNNTSNIILAPTSSDATLSAISISSPANAWTPALTAGVYSYSSTTASIGTYTIYVTPTNSGATLTGGPVGGTMTAFNPGTGSGNGLTTGTVTSVSNYVVNVTASDGITVNKYYFTITKP